VLCSYVGSSFVVQFIFIYVLIDGVWVSSCCVVYNQVVTYVSCVYYSGMYLCQGIALCIYFHNGAKNISAVMLEMGDMEASCSGW